MDNRAGLFCLVIPTQTGPKWVEFRGWELPAEAYAARVSGP
ncbi:hypothetical protein ACUXIW_004805, partial [Ralstonia pickettii]